MSDSPHAMSDSQNRLTLAALRLLDALLLKNPERTAIGVALGLFIDGILRICQPMLSSRGIDVERVTWLATVSFGLVVVHLPFIFWSVRHKPLISDDLENLLTLIESTNIGELEKRSAYRRVVNKCIDEFSISGNPGVVHRVLSMELEAAQERGK